MKIERAIEILDPEHRERYEDLEEVNEACRMGMEVLQMLRDGKMVEFGNWVGEEYDGFADGNPVYETWRCTVCGDSVRNSGEPPAYRYCPFCGAVMTKKIVPLPIREERKHGN